MLPRYFSAILAVPLLLSVQVPTLSQERVPTALQPCISRLATNLSRAPIVKRAPIEQVTIQGAYQEAKRTYYLLSIFQSEGNYSWDAVVSANQSGCRVEDANPLGDAPSTAFLPPSVARGLTLNVLKNTVQRVGGRQKYQAFLLQTARQSGNQLWLMPYEVWAIKQLGIQIPPSIRVVAPN